MTKGNTQERIQEVALRFFLERGYEKTSLREIAEELQVTKAALYYHFRTKEDILRAIVAGLIAPVDELLEWAKDQPRTPETRNEVLRRYSEALSAAGPFFRLMQDNRAELQRHDIGIDYKERMHALVAVMEPENADLTDKVRAMVALASMNIGTFALLETDAPEDKRRSAILEVAREVADRIGE